MPGFCYNILLMAASLIEIERMATHPLLAYFLPSREPRGTFYIPRIVGICLDEWRSLTRMAVST